MATEAWLRGPVNGVPRVLQPAAHALIQANEEVAALLPGHSADVLWTSHGAATPGFHVLHMAGALDRLFTYARGEALDDTQKAEVRAENQPHPDIDAAALIATLDAAVARALVQLRHTDPDRVFDERKVGRAGLPSTVLGLLFHAAEHTTRHAGQLTTTLKLSRGGE